MSGQKIIDGLHEAIAMARADGAVENLERIVAKAKPLQRVWVDADNLRAVLAALREARQQEREMAEGGIATWLKSGGGVQYADGKRWAKRFAMLIHGGDWKHSAGTGEG